MLNEGETGGVGIASYVRAGHSLCVCLGFVRSRLGESTLSPAPLYGDVNGDNREGMGGGENQRVEPGGKGCAIIRSLRGGMRSVVETLSLRIRAEPPNSPVATEGGL